MSHHCTKMFWSSPSLSRIAVMFASVAVRPAMRCAGSPPGILKKMGT